MADLNDFNKPTISDLRTDVQDTNRAHHARAIKLDPGTATNRPVGAKLAELISNVFTLKHWNGTSYDTWLSISNFVRGLLGSADAAAARTALVAVGQTDAQNNTYTAFTTGGTSAAYTLTPSPAFASYVNGAQTLWVTFHTSNGASATLNVNGLGARAILEENASGYLTTVVPGRIVAGNLYQVAIVSGGVKVIGLPAVTSVLPDYHQGFGTLRSSGSYGLFISKGLCADSTNSSMIALPLGSYKTMNTIFAPGDSGQGCLDTGTFINSVWYYVYVIRRPDTGAVDVLISQSPSSPTMPANYTQYRLISAARPYNDGGWYSVGDDIFYYSPTTTSYGAPSSTASGRLDTQKIPINLRTTAYLSVSGTGGAAGGVLYFSDPESDDVAASNGIGQVHQATASNGRRITVRADSSGRVRVRTNDTTFAPTYGVFGFNISEAKGR